ncbi:TetR/AcrR family transcriptional regulator [Asaia astilbis]|uniref:TetR/AcrR family transcriptional regulator n=1 Tax=Asaia astilbis TaxID=610244 RepID=UPI0004701ECD|nr:TetR/AcrR family transcriptional regulator [Asaia astilbis]
MPPNSDKKGRRRSTAEETRVRIMDAAKILFTKAGYDSVGVRDIAAAAEVDPAMIPRLFGSKEALLQRIADTAFKLEEAFEGPVEEIGVRTVQYLIGSMHETSEHSFHALQLLLRSIGSPAAAPILSEALHAGFISPLSKRLTVDNAAARASLATSYLIGYAVVSAGLNSGELGDQKTLSLLADAIQESLGRH